MRWTWEIKTDAEHTIVFEAGVLTGSESLWLDGKLLSDKNSFKLRNEYSVPLGGAADAKVVVGLAWYLLPKARLYINGSEIKCVKGAFRGTSLEKTMRMPGWTWIFIIACGIIPVLTRGGALPTVIGVGGAAGCAAIARNKSHSTKSKVGICALITVFAWAFLILLAILVSTIKQR